MDAKITGVGSPAHASLIQLASGAKNSVQDMLAETNRNWTTLRSKLEAYISYQVAADMVAGYVKDVPEYKP